MTGKFTTVRLTIDGDRFEILVNPELALNFKLGNVAQVSQILAVDEIYSDASKGSRASSVKLKKFFQSDDPIHVAESILKRGDLQLTTDQRRKMVDEKRKQIISNISKNYVDPKTKLPHPPMRIEQAMQQARVSIDPSTDAVEQAKVVVENLRTIIPLKSEVIRLEIKVPPQFASQTIGVLKGYTDMQDEHWGADGTLTTTIEIPAGVQQNILNRLGSVTKGEVQAVVAR